MTRVLSGIHSEGILFGLIDEAAVWLVLDCSDGEITDAHVGHKIETFSPFINIKFEPGQINDVSFDCGMGETVPAKRVSVTATLEGHAGPVDLGHLIGSSETHQLTACCSNCSNNLVTPGEKVPDDVTDLENWMDDHPSPGLTGGLFGDATVIGGPGAVW